ncbi:MAG: carbon-nitrogen hydrolase family protein [Lactobacillales bacterium]|jgi:N-carbamoylputrescine amidase|nr:carbon-nitrogen hydrolase family protein [Lactobacillales bacterium]
MKIGLVVAGMVDNDVNQQLCELEKCLTNSDVDLLCFGESFLQGFDGLTWDYKTDLKRALTLDSAEILAVRELAVKYKTALSFGFIMREDNDLYSVNLVVDARGDVVDLFKRVSTGWKEKIADEHYKEGDKFHTFEFAGKTIATAICGDLWTLGRVEEMASLKPDIVLWPLYIDYSVKVWNDSELYEYANEVARVEAPVLMINSFNTEYEGAQGGAYQFRYGRVLDALDPGESGILVVEID